MYRQWRIRRLSNGLLHRSEWLSFCDENGGDTLGSGLMSSEKLGLLAFFFLVENGQSLGRFSRFVASYRLLFRGDLRRRPQASQKRRFAELMTLSGTPQEQLGRAGSRDVWLPRTSSWFFHRLGDSGGRTQISRLMDEGVVR